MRYVTEKYVCGGTCILAYTEDGEPFAKCSVCLAEYGFVPPDDQIVIPVHELGEDTLKKIVTDIVEETLGGITFGEVGVGIIARLKPQYRPKEKTFDERLEELIMAGVPEDEALAFLELDLA